MDTQRVAGVAQATIGVVAIFSDVAIGIQRTHVLVCRVIFISTQADEFGTSGERVSLGGDVAYRIVRVDVGVPEGILQGHAPSRGIVHMRVRGSVGVGHGRLVTPGVVGSMTG
jgi:hypothetical protein